MPRFEKLSPTWFTFGLVLVVRALVAASRMDELELETYGGSLATAVLGGMPLDPDNLPIIVHLRGSVVFGFLLVPLSWLLGNGLLPVKVLAVVWSAITGALLASLLTRRGGRTAGFVAGLAFALAPPSFAKVDVIALGSHGDTILFIVLAFWYLLAKCEAGPRTWRQVATLGALCGAGFCFSMQFAVALPALAVAWWCVDRRFFLRPAVLALPLGAAPFLALVPVISGGTKLVNKSTSAHFFPEGVGGAVEKLGRTLSFELRRSWLFEEDGGAWAAWLLLGVVVLALVLLARRLRRGEAIAWGLAVYAIAFVGAYVTSDFRLDFYNTRDGMGSRYAMPLWAALAAILGLAAAELAERRSPRAGHAFTALALLPGLVGLLALSDPSTAWRQPPLLGHRLSVLNKHFEYASGGDLRRHLEWILELDPDWSGTHALAYSHPSAVRGRRRWTDRSDLAEHARRFRTVDPRLAPYLLVDLGRRAVKQAGLRAEFSQLDELDDALTEEELTWFLRGTGQGIMDEMSIHRLTDAMRTGRIGGAPEARRNMLAFQYLKQLSDQDRLAAVEGFGFYVGVSLNPYQQLLIDVVEDVQMFPAGLQRSFFHALGQGYRRRFRESTYWVPEPGALEVEQFMGELARTSFREGLAAERGGFVRI